MRRQKGCLQADLTFCLRFPLKINLGFTCRLNLLIFSFCCACLPQQVVQKVQQNISWLSLLLFPQKDHVCYFTPGITTDVGLWGGVMGGDGTVLIQYQYRVRYWHNLFIAQTAPHGETVYVSELIVQEQLSRRLYAQNNRKPDSNLRCV